MENTDKRLFLLDALALVFRAYYALLSNPRITSKGRNTNAQFGFTNALVDLINNQRPTHMAVCFDTEAPTERHTDFADYKANRQEAPEDLLIENLGNLNDQEFTFDTPMVFYHDQQLQLRVDCDGNQTSCDVSMYYTGPITEPVSATTTTIP